MTERTIYLDPDRRDPSSRRIGVRAFRWYAKVELDRDGYVDALTSRGYDFELPAAYEEAVERARGACIERIRCDGYPGELWFVGGPRWVTLHVQFPQVEAVVEALRLAEIDHDYSELHALADWRFQSMTGSLPASGS
ncbi:hypothetical protein [Streptomyces xanthophaeus]|nr:hypothetical protein [Streptomyces xanthophaeus]